MLRTRLALTIVLAAMTGAPAANRPGFARVVSAAVLSAQALYADAMAKDLAVRAAVGTGMTPDAMNKAVRAVLAAYDALVRQYPTSGYCDDALWRAAQLATDVATLAKDPAYHATAARYLKRLASEYPTSKHARQLREAPTVPAVTTDTERTAPIAALASPVPAPVPSPRAGATVTQGAQSHPSAEPAAVRSAPSASPVDAATLATPIPPAPRATVPPSGRARLLAVHRSVLPDVVRITLDIDHEVAFRQERLSGPDRTFFDFVKTTAARSLAERTIRFDQDSDAVRQVRIGQQSSDTTRVVLDTAGIASCSATPLYAPYRLVIDCVRTAAPPTGTGAVGRGLAAKTEVPKTEVPTASPIAGARPKPATPATLARKAPSAPGLAPSSAVSTEPAPPLLIARRMPIRPQPLVANTVRLSAAALSALETVTTEPPPATTPAVAAVVNEFEAPPVTTAAAAVPPPPAPASPRPAAPPSTSVVPTAPARNLNGELSIARQLGLTVSRIVIDPGHGGHDPGAQGAGTNEAAVVLDIALRLENLLRQVDGVEVILTRRTDDFVPLEERTAIANREGADLFLSIHANASRTVQAAGVETYFLNFARDRGAAAVAARENAASGKPMSALTDVVKAIAMNGKVDESRDLATHVQRALVQKLKPAHQAVRDLGVKQAPFVVLIGAAMPSVLTEVAFMTNEQEAKLLKAAHYRQRIAEALFAAVQRYQGSLTRLNATGQ